MLFLVQQDAGRINPVILTAAIALIKLLRIIRNANANANDSHVDLRIHNGIDELNTRGGVTMSTVLTGVETGIISDVFKGEFNV